MDLEFSTKSSFKMSFMRIFHVYTGGHFVVVVQVKLQKYTFNSTVNVEIMSKMFENINKSNFVAKYYKENAYRTI